MIEPRDGGPLDALVCDPELIVSREGVSTDDVARIRAQVLVEQGAVLVRQTQFADAKATAVLAFSGLVASRVALDLDVARLGAAEVALIGLKATVVVFCLLALMPRYPRGATRRTLAELERTSWVALSAPGFSADDYARFMRGAQVSQLVTSMARSNHALARLLSRKFRYLRGAFLLAMADVAATLVYYLADEAWRAG